MSKLDLSTNVKLLNRENMFEENNSWAWDCNVCNLVFIFVEVMVCTIFFVSMYGIVNVPKLPLQCATYIFEIDHVKISLASPGFEPETFSVLDWCDKKWINDQ